MSSSLLLEETVVMYSSVNGVSNARSAFDNLESKLSSLHGRKFYGVYNPETEEYRACVVIEGEDPDAESLGLHRWTIPQGKYVYEKIMGWNSKIGSIGPTMEKLIKENRGLVDLSRPFLEYYKSLNELRVMVPVNG